MTTERYNGWTNYETWAVKLWIDNEEGSYHYWQDVAQDVWDETEASEYLDRKAEATRALAERLEDEHTEGATNLTEDANVFSDLLTRALGRVNWEEIAGVLVEDVAEEEAEATEG